MKVYFDNAATTPIDEEVIDAMLPYMREHYGNPSSIHAFGRTTRSAIEQARRTVASLLHVSPAEIFFTSGGTEADNMAIDSTIKARNIQTVISSPTEHHAVLHTLEELAKSGAINLHLLDVDALGYPDIQQLEELLKKHKGAFVSLMHANNETGTRIRLKEVARLVKDNDGIYHADTVQTMGHYRINLQEVPVDMINGAAHKFHGPKGVGFIFIRSGMQISPFIHGGSQERNMRGGTENLYGIIGLAKALEIAHRDMDAHQAHIMGLKNRMVESLREKIAGVQFNGDICEKSLYTVLNVSFPAGEAGEMLLFNLDIAGIAASGGSACSSGSEIGSHVLRAMKVEPQRANVRFSFSRFNSIDEVDYTVERLQELFKPATLSQA